MLVVGLTGGIGSGKTTITNLFAERGVPIIDADEISREVTQPEEPAFHAIVKHVGPSIVQADGRLDRSKLRNIIFAEAKERHWLEDLLHPVIRVAMQKKISELKTPYCIAVIPLLFEVEFYSFINRILVIDAPEDLQIERVISRDKTSKEHVAAILKTQASRQSRVSRAHDVITNDGVLSDLIPQVDKLHAKYLSMSEHKN